MTLDKKVKSTLDGIARRTDVGNNIKDGQALDYINNLKVPKSEIYILAVYRKYYFEKKKEYGVQK